MKQDRGDKMDDTKITVTTPDNKTFQVEVLDIFNVVCYEGKDYILYTLGEEIDEDHEQAYVSILEEDNNNFNLTEIKDDKEWEAVQKAMEEGIAMETEINE